MHKRGRMGATLTVIEPSVNHQQPSRAARPRSRSSREVEHPLFAEFYAAYPRKVDPKDAVKAFAKLNPDRDLLTVMLRAIDGQGLPRRCAGGDEQFVPHPATWINKRRWEIEVAGSASSTRSWHGAVLDRDPKPPWLIGTGFANVFEADNAGCGAGNAAKYRNGEKVEA